jgi:hypothetical protein
MKHLRQICLIATLVLTFTFPVYAGEIECPGITASSQATEADSAQPQDNVVGKSTGAIPPAESNLANMTDTLILLILALI